MRTFFHSGPRVLALCLLSALGWAGCDGTGAAVAPVPSEDGLWILDTAYVIDDFPFRLDACAEVGAEGPADAAVLPPGTAASIRITSTACYRAAVHVLDSQGDTVRVFAARFGIANRSEEEKNRGVVGWIAWDGKDSLGRAAPAGRYLWRMEFDFGAGRLRRFRADIPLP